MPYTPAAMPAGKPVEVSEAQVRWFRLRRSGLVEPFSTPERAAAALAGVQAQILTAGGLALGRRVPGLSWAEVSRRLNGRRTLVKLWGQRGTLHFYESRDWPLVCGALAGQRTWWARQAERAGSGGAAAHGGHVDRVGALLRERGTISREEVRAAGLDLPESSYSAWGGVFSDLVRSGQACHVPALGGAGRFAHRAAWLPRLTWDPPPVDEANVELARRYLRAYGPARVQDLAYWRGATVAHAARWIGLLGREFAEVHVNGRAHLVLREDVRALREPAPRRDAWPVRLLGRFDPLLLAHRDKSWLIHPADARHVWRPAGHIEATILEHGRITGTWRYDRTPRGLAITLRPFAPLSRRVARAVEREAGEIARFFGEPLAQLG